MITRSRAYSVHGDFSVEFFETGEVQIRDANDNETLFENIDDFKTFVDDICKVLIQEVQEVRVNAETKKD